VRHHLALAYEATGDVQSARDQVDRALVDLEAKGGAPAAAGAQDPGPELRALRDRLQSGGG